MQQRRRAGYGSRRAGYRGWKIELSFGLAIPKFPSALSLPAAGLTEEQENAVNNVWVLQFDASGNLVLNEYYDTFTVVSTTEKKVSVALFKYAASTVYFVATWVRNCSSRCSP